MGFVERLYRDLDNGYFEKGFIHDFKNQLSRVAMPIR